MIRLFTLDTWDIWSGPDFDCCQALVGVLAENSVINVLSHFLRLFGLLATVAEKRCLIALGRLRNEGEQYLEVTEVHIINCIEK
jgi:hypothetical protein